MVFLDGDATPLAVPPLAGWLLINPFRTTILRLALSSGWLIQRIYGSQCGPACPPLTAAGVETWRQPLQQPGFAAVIGYTLRHGIPSMTSAEFGRLRASGVPKRVIVGAGDPQLSVAAAARTAARIGAPAAGRRARAAPDHDLLAPAGRGGHPGVHPRAAPLTADGGSPASGTGPPPGRAAYPPAGRDGCDGSSIPAQIMASASTKTQ